MPTVTLARTLPGGLDAIALGVTAPADDAAGVTFPAVPTPPGAAPFEVSWDHLRRRGYGAKAGEVAILPGPDGTDHVLVGLGPAAAIDASVIRRAAAALTRSTSRYRRVGLSLAGALPDGFDAIDAAQAVAEGAGLGGYTYDRFRSKPSEDGLGELVLASGGGKRAQAALDRGTATAAAVALTQDLVNEPGGSLTPPEFADRAAKAAKAAGLKVKVHDEASIARLKLGGLLGVNRGSTNPPRLVQLTYEPERPRGTLALVGKGITFDSGGLSIKTADGMATMKCDMAGAAAVVGAMTALKALGVKAKVTGWLPMTDNMLGGDATRPGDVLTARNGTTIEVLNTDAEGRLVLADALSLASESEPDAIVDLATLTGACMVALGPSIAGLLGTSQPWLDQVGAAAAQAGERVWQLPMPEDYRPMIDSSVADIKNIGGRYGGTITAALFLREFVGEGIPWAHLDIAGPAFAESAEPEHPKGATGFGVRTLIELASSFRPPKG